MKYNALILVVYCGLIFMLSHQPSFPAPMLFVHQDKLIHGIAYAIMGLLTWRMFIYLPKPRIWVGFAAVIFCSLYGMSDEFHQSFIEGRDADVWDWFADTVGASLMVGFLAWRRYKI